MAGTRKLAERRQFCVRSSITRLLRIKLNKRNYQNIAKCLETGKNKHTLFSDHPVGQLLSLLQRSPFHQVAAINKYIDKPSQTHIAPHGTWLHIFYCME